MHISKKQQPTNKALLRGLSTLQVEILALWVARVNATEFQQFMKDVMLCYLIHDGELLQQSEWEDYLHTIEMLHGLDQLSR
uniref:hypothetical protein n=1 Tax=Roseivirga sp. TaxID=1964215 RepID=UPI0040489450